MKALRRRFGTFMIRIGLLVSFMTIAASLASAQTSTDPATILPEPKPDLSALASSDSGVNAEINAIENLLESGPKAPELISNPLPYAPSSLSGTGLPDAFSEGALYMISKLTEDGPPLSSGVVWRVYNEELDEEGKLKLVASASGGDAEFRLDPGEYLVHTSYGHAGATTRIRVGNGISSETIVLNAGGIKLDAELSEGVPIKTPEDVSFDIYATDFDSRGERRLIAANIPPGNIVRLNSDTYHVVSRFGTVNAVVRADIQVQPGKLTEATVYHNAANITMKLVKEDGGEALANTAWSVLTPGGDVVVEANGAFPSFVLSSGGYQVIARNNGKIFSRKFEVNTGQDSEVEVLASTTN